MSASMPTTGGARMPDRAPDDLWVVVYMSTATLRFTRDRMLALMAVSRLRNSLHDITGLLLHRDGGFMQALEGPRSRVHALLGALRRDDRHAGLVVVIDEPRARRAFDGWSMAFRDLDTSGVPDGVSPLLSSPAVREEFRTHPDRVHRLLHYYADTELRSLPPYR